MSWTLYTGPLDDPQTVVVEIADPGSAYFEVEHGDKWFTFEGRQMTQLLSDLTEVATTDTTAPDATYVEIPGLWRMPVSSSRRLLRAVQQAVVYAAVRGERAERIMDDPDPAAPQPPLCVSCDVNLMDSTANSSPNPWCEKHGHTTYGRKFGSRAVWERAEQAYQRHRRQADQPLAGGTR